MPRSHKKSRAKGKNKNSNMMQNSSTNDQSIKKDVDLESPSDSGMGISSSNLSEDLSLHLSKEDSEINLPYNKGQFDSKLLWSPDSEMDSGVGIECTEMFSSASSITSSFDSKSGHLKLLSPDSAKGSSIINTPDTEVPDCYIYQDDDGDTPLHLAVVKEAKDSVFRLVAEDPQYLNVMNCLYQTPLHLAVMTCQPSLVRRLVIAGSSIYQQDHRGNTPLQSACQLKCYQCVRALTVKAVQGELDQAKLQYQPFSGLYKFNANAVLIRDNEGLSCIHLAALGGHNILEHLVDCGADLNIKEGKSGNTALHLCVQYQDVTSVHFLLSRCKASVHVRNYAGRSPLGLALKIQRWRGMDSTAGAIVKLLQEEKKKSGRGGSTGFQSQGEESSSEEDESDDGFSGNE